jgi:hypothetical protein
MEKTCPHCGKRFLPHPAVFNQRYCGSTDCQRARKKSWQKEKLKSDPDYRENQAAAQKGGAQGTRATGEHTGRTIRPTANGTACARGSGTGRSG